ncbi:Ger(x)C family spore germination protein [Desulfotomaculum defluvii]
MRKAMITLLVSCICITITGCWDLTEPERLGLVMAVGIDQDENNDIRITCAEVNVQSVGGGSAGGGGGSGNGPPFHVHSGTGKTVFDAIRRLSMEAAYRLFFAHTQVIILSEEMARSRGIKPIIDFFERNEEIRRSTWFLIAKEGQLDKIITADMPIKTSKGQFLAGIIEHRERNAFFAPNRLGDFIEIFSEEGNEPYTAGVAIHGVPLSGSPASFGDPQKPRTSDMVVLDTAVFKQDKMVGWLNDWESRGLIWVKGEGIGGIITTYLDGQRIALEVINGQSKVEPEIKDGQIQIRIKVKVESNIGDSEANLDFSKTQTIKKVEALQAEAVKKEINLALNKSRELNTDIFGFGRALHAKYPDQWKQIRKGWYDYYPNIDVKIAVESKIKRIGLVTKPAQRSGGE